MPKATLDALAADKAKLKAVLTYHVVAGKHLAADVVKMKEVKTVAGRRRRRSPPPAARRSTAPTS